MDYDCPETLHRACGDLVAAVSEQHARETFRGSWATRRRALLRSGARRKRRCSSFWASFLTVMSWRGQSHIGLSWPHGSSATSRRSSDARVTQFLTSALEDLDDDERVSAPTASANNESVLEALGNECDDGDIARQFPTPSCRVESATTTSKEVTLGCDCCGLCTPYFALRDCGIQVSFEFASDSSHQVKLLARERSPPKVWYDNIFGRRLDDPGLVPVDIYTAGFPCQPFSSVGQRLGLLDARGTVFFEIASYIRVKLPKIFVLETGRGLLCHDHGNTFRLVMQTLESISGQAYVVQHRLFNTEDFGIPQRRERLYVAGHLRCNHPDAVELPSLCRRVSLDTFLDPPPVGDIDLRKSEVQGTHARRSLLSSLDLLERRGCKPASECIVIDIDASVRFRTIMKDRCPCLLRSRAKGYFVTNRARRLTLAEMCRLQGFPAIVSNRVSSAGIASMLGNAMSLPVVKEILKVLMVHVSIHDEAFYPRIASPFGDAPLLQTLGHLPALLTCWIDTVLSSSTSFGRYACKFVQRKSLFREQRQRDCLPLPYVEAKTVAHWKPSLNFSLALNLLNVAVAGLNFLFSGDSEIRLPRKPSACQCAIVKRLVEKLDRSLFELALVHGRVLNVNGSFGRLTCKDVAGKYPSLRYNDVDYLDPSSQIDPMPALPSNVWKILCSPELLFPAGTTGVSVQCSSRDAHEGDRIALTIRLLRCKKLSLMKFPSASADTFPIEKPGTSRIREVWHGGPLTRAALQPPKPPHQASPAALASLECTDDRPLWLSARDGKSFFDQLAAPHSLRQMFGRPKVNLEQLMDPPPCESGAPAQEGLSLEEVNELTLDGPVDHSTLDVTPVQNCFPMGFGWSSYVAQAEMLDTVFQAGYSLDQILTEERVIPLSAECGVAVATDDVNVFNQFSASEVCEVGSPPLKQLDEVWKRIGLVGQPEKA